MLAGQNFVYLGPEKWHGLWRNRHWLMSLFARHNKVLYVEPYVGLRPTLSDWTARRLSLAPWRWQAFSRESDQLYVFHQPPFAPANGLPILGPASAAERRYELANAARRLGLDHPVVWISRPWVADMARTFDARLTIYHVVDEYSAYPGQSEAERAHVQQAEAPVLAAADLVLVSSLALLEAKRPFNPHTYCVPNGVNAAGYWQQIEKGGPLPPTLSAIPHPRLGYLGQIGSKLDFDLLQALAAARPNWSLVFVGSMTSGLAQVAWDRLRALPNVYDLGPVPAAEVPAYVCGFDVGLMPYRTSAHTQFIDPLKLYDYLAAGLPVVSVDLPALAGFRSLVRTGNSAPEFIEAIEAALADTGAAAVSARRQAAADNSWERRVETIGTLIQERLDETGSRAAAMTAAPAQGPAHRGDL